MDPIGLTLTLLAGLWASATLFLNVTKQLNELRDAILTGRQRGDDIDLEHRQLVLDSDWTPLLAVLLLICLGFAAIAFGLSELIEPNPEMKLLLWTARLACATSLLSGAIWLVYGYRDHKFMRARLRRDLEQQAE